MEYLGTAVLTIILVVLFIYFTNKNILKISQGLKLLKKEALVLNKEFKEIHKGFLFDIEIEIENQNRNKKLNALYDRIFKKRDL